MVASSAKNVQDAGPQERMVESLRSSHGEVRSCVEVLGFRGGVCGCSTAMAESGWRQKQRSHGGVMLDIRQANIDFDKLALSGTFPVVLLPAC